MIGNLPYALSVHSLVNSAGADVGFASLLGLAILVLLFFSQARETASLRERLDESAERVESLEGRLHALQRSQAAPLTAPQGAAPTAQKPAAAAAAPALAGATITASRGPAILPIAPAGVAAPALTAATKLIPTVAPAPRSVPQAVPSPVPVGVGASTPAAASAGASPAASSAPAGTADESTVLTPTPAPATSAAVVAANGGSQAPPPPSPRTTPLSSRSASRSSVEFARPQAGAGPGARSNRPTSPLRAQSMRQPSLARRLLPVLIGLGAVAVIVVVLLIITRSGTTSTPLAHSAKTSVRARHHVARPIAFNPATVTVAVLNGTAVTNLAHDVGLRLAGSGYKEGTLATAADQTHTTTIVEYLPGHQLDAREVAAALKLKPSAVQPADPQSLGVACPGTPAACQADVIVTVGTDLASAAQTTTG